MTTYEALFQDILRKQKGAVRTPISDRLLARLFLAALYQEDTDIPAIEQIVHRIRSRKKWDMDVFWQENPGGPLLQFSVRLSVHKLGKRKYALAFDSRSFLHSRETDLPDAKMQTACRMLRNTGPIPVEIQENAVKELEAAACLQIEYAMESLIDLLQTDKEERYRPRMGKIEKKIRKLKKLSARQKILNRMLRNTDG